MRYVKSGWFLSIGVVVLLLAAASGVMAQSVVINGLPLATTRTPVTMGGSMLLPMRDVFEALQSEVKWFASEQKVMAVRGQTTVELWIGRRYATVNGVQVPLPVAPMMMAGSTYVPLRFPAEAFGGTVEWQAATRTALINIPALDTVPSVQPPVVQPPVVQPPAVEPPPVTPPAPQVFEGTVLQVLAYPPSLLLQLAGTGLPQAIAVAERTTITRGTQAAQPSAVQLADARPGDYAVATLGADNLADSVVLTYGELQGKVLALANNVLVLDDGTAFRLAEGVRVVGPTGQTLPLTSVAQNAAVSLGFDPASRTVWEIRLPSVPAVTPPPATDPATTKPAVQIITVGVTNPGTVFGAGQTLNLRLQGTPGGQAKMYLTNNVARDIPMRETDPGVYVGQWQVPQGTERQATTLAAVLRVGTGEARASSSDKYILDSVPPRLLTVEPDRETTINNDSPTITMTFAAGGTDLNPNGVTLLVNRRNVTRDVEVEADRITYRATALPPGRVNVDAIVKDLAGNETRPTWSFTIRATASDIIKSVSHDAKQVSVAGDKIEIKAQVARPGGAAAYTIVGLAPDKPMRRIGATNNYIGSYTIKPGDRANRAVVYVTYLDPAGTQARMEATARVTIDTTLPTALRIVRPLDQSTVGDTLVVSGEAAPYSRVRVTVTYRARVVTWITGQLSQDVIETTAQGTWTTPEMETSIGLFGRADQYIILAELLDNAGTVKAQQQITVKK